MNNDPVHYTFFINLSIVIFLDKPPCPHVDFPDADLRGHTPLARGLNPGSLEGQSTLGPAQEKTYSTSPFPLLLPVVRFL